MSSTACRSRTKPRWRVRQNVGGINPALARSPLNSTQPERHRVDHRPQGRVGDGDLRQPRRERRRSSSRPSGARARARSIEYETYVAASSPLGTARVSHRQPVPVVHRRSRSPAGVLTQKQPRDDLGTVEHGLGGRAHAHRVTRRTTTSRSPAGRQSDQVPRVAQLLRPAGRRYLEWPQALSGTAERPSTRRSTGRLQLGSQPDCVARQQRLRRRSRTPAVSRAAFSRTWRSSTPRAR